jgi:hypothetical protein
MIWDLVTICEIISILLTFSSAFCFAPQLMRKDEEIWKMSLNLGSRNPAMQSALTKDRRNAQIGMCLLSLGISFQMLSIYLK